MPLKLVPPRQGKSPNWTIRGTYLRVYVDKSSGTDRRSLARAVMRRIESEIERGEYHKPPAPRVAVPTFLSAAVAYLEAGRRRRYVAGLIKHFGETPLPEVDQVAIDAAAAKLHPNCTPATRNTCVYTPVSAILRHAGVNVAVRRPKGAKGCTITDALSVEDAAAIINAAKSFDPEYSLLLIFLLYTGCRLGEALALRWEDCRLTERAARIRRSKNGMPRELRLRADLTDALKRHRGKDDRFGRIFRFHQGGWLKWQLLRAKLKACGLPEPMRPKQGEKFRAPPHRLSWVNHHTFCHTWATWLRRYGGLDAIGLAATGRWLGPRGAARYVHAVPREEWARVEDLPALKRAVE